MSTYEKELSLLGEDYQEVFAQQVRESKERKEAGLTPASCVKMAIVENESKELIG